MMNNVALMFSPTDEKTPYEQGENRTVRTVQSVAAPSTVVLNLLNVSWHGPSLKGY